MTSLPIKKARTRTCCGFGIRVFRDIDQPQFSTGYGAILVVRLYIWWEREMDDEASCIFESRLSAANRTRYFRSPASKMKSSTEILALAVERGLFLFGENVAQVILYNLDKRFSISKSDIIEDPERFTEALGLMFGSGAAVVEKLIIRHVCVTIGIDPSTLDPPTFSNCIDLAKDMLDAGRRHGD